MVILSLKKDLETNLLSAEITPENRLLSDFLETEIQQDRAYIDYLLNQATMLENLPFEINGNAYGLILTNVDYKITALYSDEMTSGPLPDLLDILRQWREFLQPE
ncbi:MAG: hypothetical protein NXI13_01760 [Proteobacteria bacterium]|nr:hypothetical protein [Pseudomonadota bacterium]